MERDFRKGKLPVSKDVDCGGRWNRSSSEASSLTVQNWEDLHHRSMNDDGPAWTDEKHGMYLESLEVSFVKQLHKSMGSYGQRSTFHNAVEQRKALVGSSDRYYANGHGNEGSGQNFVDEVHGKSSSTKSHKKRYKK